MIVVWDHLMIDLQFVICSKTQNDPIQPSVTPRTAATQADVLPAIDDEPAGCL